LVDLESDDLTDFPDKTIAIIFDFPPNLASGRDGRADQGNQGNQ